MYCALQLSILLYGMSITCYEILHQFNGYNDMRVCRKKQMLQDHQQQSKERAKKIEKRKKKERKKKKKKCLACFTGSHINSLKRIKCFYYTTVQKILFPSFIKAPAVLIAVDNPLF